MTPYSVLITGASGYVGTFITSALLRIPEVHVISLGRKPHELIPPKSSFRQIPFELHEHSEVKSSSDYITGVIGSLHTKVIVLHAAACTSIRECEEQSKSADVCNVRFSEIMAGVARHYDAHAIYFSTDLVYDGAESSPHQGFQSSDPACPRSQYGKTKFEGEQHFLDLPQGAVLRLSLVYGPPMGTRNSFLQWVEDRAAKQQPIPLFIDEWRTPVVVSDVFKAVMGVIDQGLLGLYHCGGPERLSRVEFGEAVVPECKEWFAPTYRESVPHNPPRPRDVSLQSDGLFSLCGVSPERPADTTEWVRAWRERGRIEVPFI